MRNKIKQYFGKLKGNAKVCIACHPFWGIPYTIYTYYISLYLQEIGISSGELGTLMVIGTGAAFVFSLLSAPIIDRMGRKSATFVFDLLSSAVPPLIYFFTKDFAGALIAQILFNTSRIMSVAYYLVMIEDAEDETRIVAFNLFNIITVVAGLIMPLAGILVDRFGLVKMERIFLLVSFAVMAVMIIVRNILLRETKVGTQIREKVRAERKHSGSLREMVKPYADAFGFLLKNRVARAVVLANLFFCVYINLGTNYSLYFVPYFTDRLGMDTMQASMLGSIYYAGMLLAMICINPLTGKKGILGSILVSGCITLLGLGLMVCIPAKVYWLAIVSVMIMAVGYGILKSSVDGVMAVYSESEFRSGIYSLTNLLSAGLGMLVTAICSALYTKFTGWLYILCGLMVLSMLVCIFSVRKENAEENVSESR